MSSAIIDVLAERKRQINEEGWDAAHDDEHDSGDLCLAGAAYALNAGCTLNPLAQQPLEEAPEFWPWLSLQDISGGRGDTPLWAPAPAWWKPKSPRRDLVRAAALILAEIDRIDRQALRENKKHLATCIGCGCDDDHACPDGCWWLRVDYTEGKGVCSECNDHVEAWDRGDHTSHARPLREQVLHERIHRPEQKRPAGDEPCKHDWPFEDAQMSDQCRWCGMSFTRHVFTECP